MYPPSFDWHRMVQRPHHLLWEAARAGHVVIFCNATKRADRAMETVAERVYVCHNFEMLLRTKLPRPVIYFTDPSQLPLIQGMERERLVFDLMDDLGDAAGPALRLADEVWCASEALVDRVAVERPDALLVPNACDFAHWANPGTEPVAATVLPHPRVAYIGRVADWIDVPALCRAAREMPETHFLLVGPVETASFREAEGIQNLHCVGEHFYPQLPAFAHSCDALIAPYRADSEVARAADPIKLWNYRAVGRPIVTDLAALGPALAGSIEPAAIDAARQTALSRRWSDSWRTAAATWEGVPA